jgi:ATP-dependent Clp protease adaptor protein ClpS
MNDTNTKTKENTKTKTVTIAKPREQIITPKLYKVMLHNNNDTSADAVVEVLTRVFEKTHQESHRIMMTAHNDGVAQVFVSTKDICDTKVNQAQNYGQTNRGRELFNGRSHYFEYLRFDVEEAE